MKKTRKILIAFVALFYGINLCAQSSTAGALGNNYVGGNFLGWGTTSGDLSFRTNNLNRMTLQNNTGLLGLGTTAPVSLLHLNSTATGNLFRTDGPAGSLNQWQLFTNSITGITATDGFQLGINQHRSSRNQAV